MTKIASWKASPKWPDFFIASPNRILHCYSHDIPTVFPHDTIWYPYIFQLYIYIYLYVSDGHSNDVIYHIPIYHHISYTQKIFQLKLPPVSPVERSPCRDQEITSTPKRHGPPPGSSPATPTRPTLRRTSISRFSYDFPHDFHVISLWFPRFP